MNLRSENKLPSPSSKKAVQGLVVAISFGFLVANVVTLFTIQLPFLIINDARDASKLF